MGKAMSLILLLGVPFVLLMLCAFNLPSHALRAVKAIFKGDAEAEQEHRDMACICMGCGTGLLLYLFYMIMVLCLTTIKIK